MFNWQRIKHKLQEKKAQILLPSVLLAPIFILVIYLLFETAKVSMAKVREQFALDNAAYTQVSAASTYLNALGMVNGPLPYRVMLYYKDQKVNATDEAKRQGRPAQVSVFELFYHGGGIPAIGPDYATGINPPPKAESTDWGLRYDPAITTKDENHYPRTDWEKESPTEPSSGERVPVMSRDLVDNYYLPAVDFAQNVILYYLQMFLYVGSTYDSKTYVYEQNSKNAVMFRSVYYLNVSNCKRSDCARQSAAKLRNYLPLNSQPFYLNKVRFFVSDSSRSGAHYGAYNLDFNMEEVVNGKMFQFAYLDPGSRTRLRQFGRGIVLKQNYTLPKNHFNINLEQKYKPYVRTTVKLQCPRANNNCVWPNPLPKYNVTLAP